MSDRKHIFATAGEIRAHYPFADTLEFDDLKPTLRLVEMDYLLPYIDGTTWQGILDAMEDEEATAIWAELAQRTATAAAHLLALRHMDKGNVIFGAAGLLVARTEHTVPASEFRTQQLRSSLTDDAQSMLDKVFEWLESNTAVFSDWAESVERAESAGLIIRSASEFDEYYPFGRNRYLWRMMIPVQRRVLRTEIRAEIGKAVVDEIATALADGDLGDYAEIIDELRGAIAWLTVANAIPTIQQRWGAMGVAIFDSTEVLTSQRRSGDEGSRLQFLRNDCFEKGKSDLMKLKIHMDSEASADKFETYFGSGYYSSPDVNYHDANETKEENPNSGYLAL